MRAGDLDRRITLQTRTFTQDALGAPREQFADVATVWAQWKPQRASERFSSGREVDLARGAFVIRYRSDIAGLNEILFNGVRYEVDGEPVEIGRRWGLEIPVKRRGE